MAVTIPGVVLSSLIFRLKSSAGDSVSLVHYYLKLSIARTLITTSFRFQIGLLLGEMHSHSVTDITDTQSAGTREERRICGCYSQWFVDSNGVICPRLFLRFVGIQSYLMLETRFE